MVDLCPVGALLDKDFLFKQRVWLLKPRRPASARSMRGGKTSISHHNEGKVYRVKPRHNADVNGWWISDDTRYSYQADRPIKLESADGRHEDRQLRGAGRLTTFRLRRWTRPRRGWVDAVKTNGNGSIYAVLSPMMACEEAYLLGQAIRKLDPQAVLAMGPVPTTGQNQVFKNPNNGKQTFVIQAEKVPNAAGVRRVLQTLGGPQAGYADLVQNADLKGGWVVGGYLSNWATNIEMPKGFTVVQDILPNRLTASADVLLPAAAWAEKDGCWENYAGRIQPFAAAVAPPDGTRREGDVYLNLLGRREAYNAEVIRAEMGAPFAAVKIAADAVAEPAFEFAEL